MAEYIRNIDISSGVVTSGLVQEIMKYIRIHISEDISLESIARTFSISPQSLSSLFRQNTDQGFKKYITELRLSNAVKYLSHSDLLITEICYETGFGTMGNFIRRFKEKYGITPSDYRLQFKDN